MTSTVQELHRRGTLAQMAEGIKEESTKVGTLRAGNAGILLGTGDVAGACHRKTLLRFMGISAEEKDIQRELMFAAGRSNEDIWAEVLLAAGEPGLVLKREEEIPISWTTSGGVQVTGRPDIVLGRNNEEGIFVPERGLELKLASSLWTARDVLFKQKPKMVHLVQAGHYSWKVGVPFELWYTNRVDFAVVSDFVTRMLPKQGEAFSEYLEYNEKGGVKKILPFITGYELRWTDKGQLQYRAVDTSTWVSTIITQSSIEKYYEYVAAMQGNKDLGSRPVNVEADGERAGFKLCDYCDLDGICTNFASQGYDRWLKEVKKMAIDNE